MTSHPQPHLLCASLHHHVTNYSCDKGCLQYSGWGIWKHTVQITCVLLLLFGVLFWCLCPRTQHKLVNIVMDCPRRETGGGGWEEMRKECKHSGCEELRPKQSPRSSRTHYKTQARNQLGLHVLSKILHSQQCTDLVHTFQIFAVG